MGTRSPEIDAYIAKAPDFARPILERIREDLHAAGGQLHEEMKWSNPAFVQGTIIGAMAAFKGHVTCTLWRGADIEDPLGLLTGKGRSAMRSMKFEDVDLMPGKRELRSYFRAAIQLDASEHDLPSGGGKKATKKKAAKKKVGKKRAAKKLPVPDDLTQALTTNAAARETFEGFSQSKRNEYIEWIEDAKRPATREKRLGTTIEWLEEGKSRNWKYEC